MLHPRTRLPASAIAVLFSLLVSGCTSATLGASPGTIFSTVSTVIANLPRSGPSDSRTSPTPTSRRRIPDSPAPSAAAARVLRTGDAYLGIKYVWGGNSPSEGFDCSGFTKYVFAKNGVSLPRTSREQARVGDAVPLDYGAMLPGDILLFAEPGEAVSHVAIYVGSGRIIHASSAAGEVSYLDLDGSRGAWYVQNLVAVRRLL